MSLYIQFPIQQIADGLTAIGWSSAGGGGDATLSYSATEPATPINGTLWYDTTATLLKLYTGGTWTAINVSAETIATISGYVTLAQSAANDATQKLTEFKAIQVTATTLSAGASATASYNIGTGFITIGVPTGIKGDAGEVSTAQLTTALSTKADTINANTFTAPQRTSITSQTNSIDFRLNNNFTVSATSGFITTTSLIGCTGQSGVITITNAQNITGWGVAFVFKTIPTGLTGTEVFAYFIESETTIRIGRVS